MFCDFGGSGRDWGSVRKSGETFGKPRWAKIDPRWLKMEPGWPKMEPGWFKTEPISLCMFIYV